MFELPDCLAATALRSSEPSKSIWFAIGQIGRPTYAIGGRSPPAMRQPPTSVSGERQFGGQSKRASGNNNNVMLIKNPPDFAPNADERPATILIGDCYCAISNCVPIDH